MQTKVRKTITMDKAIAAILDANCVRHGDVTFHVENALREYFKTEKKADEKPKPKTRMVFTPPTYSEVLEYCQSRNNFVEAQRFIDFYESNGWKVGKNKMKCWKAAVRNWEKNSKADHTKQAQKKTPLQRSLSDAEQLQAYYANEQAGHGYVGQDESTIPAQVGGAGRGIDRGRQTQPQLLDLVPSDGEFK